MDEEWYCFTLVFQGLPWSLVRYAWQKCSLIFILCLLLKISLSTDEQEFFREMEYYQYAVVKMQVFLPPLRPFDLGLTSPGWS